jgi:hypothetical protein
MRTSILTSNYRPWPRPSDFPLGSLESRAAARAVLLAADLEKQEQEAAQFKNLTPYEQEFIELFDGPEAQAGMLYMLRKVIIPKSQIFGWPLPSLVEARHRLQVAKEVKRIEAERAAQEDTEFPDE